MRSSKVTVFNRRLGNVKITVDSEDVAILQDYNLEIKHLDNPARNPIVIARPIGAANQNDYFHVSRLILSEHELLDYKNNVFYKNNDSYDLRKKNLSQGIRVFN